MICLPITSNSTKTHSALRQRPPKVPEGVLVQLAGAALLDAQHRADFAQTELSGNSAAEPASGTAPGNRSDFLTQNRRTLMFRNHDVWRMLGRRRNSRLQIAGIVRCLSKPPCICRYRSRRTPHRIEHFPPYAELRITRQRHAVLRPESTLRLEKSDISRLNQVRHFNAGSLRKTSDYPARHRTHQSIHVGQSLRRRISAQPCAEKRVKSRKWHTSPAGRGCCRETPHSFSLLSPRVPVSLP